jgi:tetratricopeptide (TPR) repeat protein
MHADDPRTFNLVDVEDPLLPPVSCDVPAPAGSGASCHNARDVANHPAALRRLRTRIDGLLALAAVLLVSAGLDLMTGALVLGAGPQREGPDGWVERLASWVRAVEEHTPGEKDAPALIMGPASEEDLAAIRVDLSALLSMRSEANKRGTRDKPIKYKNLYFTVPRIEEILGLTAEESAPSNGNRILERGAILHADVAMLVLPDMPWRAGCSDPAVVLVQDGQPVGNGCSGIHWAHGRALLDAVLPNPGKVPMVRLWYEATIADRLERGDYAGARSQIDRSAVYFPNDPGLLFQRGYFHEVFAAPRVLSAAHATGADQRPASALLKAAESFYGRALKANPDFVEARVHRGAVLGRLGRHDEAAAELRKAAASAQGPVLRYYAAMLLGDEEQALGGRDAAHARYEEAAALFPRAQSPRIALSGLARRFGDRGGALLAMRHALTLPADERARPDPWWMYYHWLNQSSDVLLRDLYRPFLAGGTS